MPSRAIAMESTTVVFAAEKYNAKIIPNILTIDNYNGSQPAVISLQDRFTPSVTNGVPSPSVKKISRLKTTVDNGGLEIIGDALKDVEILGQAEVTIGTMDSSCFVTLGYDFE